MWLQFVHAPADLEEVERIVHQLFSGSTRGKRSVINGAAAQGSDLRGDRHAREGVLDDEAQQRCGAQLQALNVGLREFVAECLVQNERCFKVAASESVFDCVNPVPKIEASCSG